MPTKDGLTKEQRVELDLHTATDKMFDKYPTQVAGYEPLKDEVALHKGHIKSINDLLPEKMRNTVIITETKNENRVAIENKYRPICAITSTFAKKSENASLAAAMKLGSRKLLTVADLNFLVTVENINTAITPVIADPEYVKYGITAAMLTDGLKDATTFSGSLGSNRQAKESVSVASLAIEQLFVPLRGDKTDITSLMQYFNPKGGIKPDETFYNSIIAALTVNELAKVHTTIDGHIYEAGAEKKVIKKAQVKNLTTGKLGISDLLGYYCISKFKGGVFEFEISAEGYKTITVVVTIVMGKHVTMDFSLVVSG